MIRIRAGAHVAALGNADAAVLFDGMALLVEREQRVVRAAVVTAMNRAARDTCVLDAAHVVRLLAECGNRNDKNEPGGHYDEQTRDDLLELHDRNLLVR